MASSQPTLEEIEEPLVAVDDYKIIGQATWGRCIIVIVEKRPSRSYRRVTQGARYDPAPIRCEPERQDSYSLE